MLQEMEKEFILKNLQENNSISGSGSRKMCRICLTGIYPSFDEHTPNYFRGPAVTSVTEDIFYSICIETTKS